MLRRCVGAFLPRGDSLWLALAFATLSVGTSMHRQIFSNFHMKMYLEVYGIGASAVAGIHLIFAFVNPANDLCGAVVSDAYATRFGGSRLGLIAILCLFWPCSTLLPFWPFFPRALGPVNAALVGLCTEDTIFSFVAIAIGAAWTDATRDEDERVRMSRVGMLAQHLVQSIMAGLTYSAWARSTETPEWQQSRSRVANRPGRGEGDDSLEDRMSSFASFATTVGVIGALVAFVGIAWLRRLLHRLPHKPPPSSYGIEGSAPSEPPPSSWQLLVGFARVLRVHRNFWAFAVMSVLNELLSTFFSEFAPILTDVFLRGSLTSAQRATYLSVETGCVAASALLCSAIAQWRGVRATYLYTTVVRVVAGTILVLLPPSGAAGAAYLLLCNSATGGVMALWAVLIASVADEHRFIASRASGRPSPSIISLLYGLHALLAKPTCSIAPVLGSRVLANVGWTGAAMSGDVTPQALEAGYRLVCALPLVCGVAQLVAWRFFDLDGAKLLAVSRPDRLRAAEGDGDVRTTLEDEGGLEMEMSEAVEMTNSRPQVPPSDGT